MKRFAPRGYRGRSLETIVVASQRDVIRIEKMQAGARFLRGGKSIPVPGPVDFIGTVVATGRAIHFDAKQTDYALGFKMSLLKPHQIFHLDRFDKAMAIAGVLAECTADSVAAFFWLDAALLAKAVRFNVATIPWTDARVIRLGDNKHAIQFQNVPEIAGELRKAAA
ncbi:MAG: Holliday junction resolvase RecU [Tepidisphaeraceae bacterium]